MMLTRSENDIKNRWNSLINRERQASQKKILLCETQPDNYQLLLAQSLLDSMRKKQQRSTKRSKQKVRSRKNNLKKMMLEEEAPLKKRAYKTPKKATRSTRKNYRRSLPIKEIQEEQLTPMNNMNLAK